MVSCISRLSRWVAGTKLCLVSLVVSEEEFDSSERPAVSVTREPGWHWFSIACGQGRPRHQALQNNNKQQNRWPPLWRGHVGGSLRLLKLWHENAGESRRKARRKLDRSTLPNNRVPADAKACISTRFALFFLRWCWITRLAVRTSTTSVTKVTYDGLRFSSFFFFDTQDFLLMFFFFLEKALIFCRRPRAAHSGMVLWSCVCKLKATDPISSATEMESRPHDQTSARDAYLSDVGAKDESSKHTRTHTANTPRVEPARENLCAVDSVDASEPLFCVDRKDCGINHTWVETDDLDDDLSESMIKKLKSPLHSTFIRTRERQLRGRGSEGGSC